MNTANLQLEGLYAAVAALMSVLRDKNLLDAAEIERALAAAEDRIKADHERAAQLSPSNIEAIRFPLRFLRLANKSEAEGRKLGFTELTGLVGEMER